MADTPESTKDAAGRAKEAVGDLTGDREMQSEGKLEQTGEKVKSGVDKATQKAKDLLHKSDDK